MRMLEIDGFRLRLLAFATAAAALDLWDDDFQRGIVIRAKILERWCDEMETLLPSMVTARGIGMMRGLWFCEPETAHAVAEKAAFRGLLIECCGPRDEVLKILAPLTIDLEIFNDGLARLADCIQEAAAERGIPVLEVNEAPLDPYDHCRDAVIGA
jgi:diaminobutyrate-2-oxoglutarate transaminase